MVELESSNPELITQLGMNDLHEECEQYLTRLLDNIVSRFQSVHLVTLLSNLDPRISQSAKPDSIMEWYGWT